MRILALTNLYPSPARPNRAPFNRQQFAALAAQHDVQVIAPVAWTDSLAARLRPVPPPRPTTTSGASAPLPPTVHYPRYYFTPRAMRRCYGHFLLRSVRADFHKVVADLRPDAVLGCWAYPDGWAAVRLAREAGLPVAIKVHGSDLLTLADHPARLRPTRDALAAADAVIAVSRHLADAATALGADPARTHIVRNGIDRALFHPAPREAARQRLGLSPSAPLLLFVGNLLPVKGPDLLLDALASLARTSVPFECALIGAGPLKPSLLAAIERLGLAGRVSLLGPRPLADLPDWYRAADLLVLPSRSEGIPNVLLEAAACGTPFIATSVGGIPEIAPPDRLVPPGDAAALADAIRRSLSAASRPSTPPTPAPHTPQSWADSAASLASVLQCLIERHAAQPRRAA